MMTSALTGALIDLLEPISFDVSMVPDFDFWVCRPRSFCATCALDGIFSSSVSAPPVLFVTALPSRVSLLGRVGTECLVTFSCAVSPLITADFDLLSRSRSFGWFTCGISEGFAESLLSLLLKVFISALFLFSMVLLPPGGFCRAAEVAVGVRSREPKLCNCGGFATGGFCGAAEAGVGVKYRDEPGELLNCGGFCAAGGAKYCDEEPFNCGGFATDGTRGTGEAGGGGKIRDEESFDCGGFCGAAEAAGGAKYCDVELFNFGGFATGGFFGANFCEEELLSCGGFDGFCGAAGTDGGAKVREA